ncbi:MAG: hypothetical protein K9J16_05280 [Melioribacteraceae bacterium]|nr:hypothetical protein [Melioribacteraceae bacterium]MCF8392977.1 hypothetical protein [Melioribacteraceae bacterium]MCF8417280.1 hypothetical protein [Melioribacteraceae bacterium]
MNLIRQYVLQSITNAANHLRLSSMKIEVISIIKEHIAKCDDLTAEIQKMKKVTELSKFAIKLGEINNYISNSNVDFNKISEIFKIQSHELVRSMSNLLDILTPERLNELLDELSKKDQPIKVELNKTEETFTEQIDQNVTKENDEELPQTIKEPAEEKKSLLMERDELKKQIILDDVNEDEDFDFESYEETILKPIRRLDDFLNNVSENDFSNEEVERFIILIDKNFRFSKEVGFNLIAEMHKIFLNGLKVIRENNNYDRELLVESMRACLIVIAAILKGKEVDITDYLNKAEEFGKYLLIKK